MRLASDPLFTTPRFHISKIMHPGVARDTGYFTSDPKQRPTRDYKREGDISTPTSTTHHPPRYGVESSLSISTRKRHLN
jgi:hypothetical protein